MTSIVSEQKISWAYFKVNHLETTVNADGKFFSANYKAFIHGLFFKDLMATVQNQAITYYQIA